MDRNDDDRLEDFFAAARGAARGAAAQPSAALMARILADAEAEAPRGQPTAAPPPGQAQWPPRPASRAPRFGLAGALGGWGGLGGLVTATVAGLWFGYAGPGDATSVAAGLVGAAATTGATEILPGGETIALLAGWEG